MTIIKNRRHNRAERPSLVPAKKETHRTIIVGDDKLLARELIVEYGIYEVQYYNTDYIRYTKDWVYGLHKLMAILQNKVLSSFIIEGNHANILLKLYVNQSHARPCDTIYLADELEKDILLKVKNLGIKIYTKDQNGKWNENTN